MKHVSAEPRWRLVCLNQAGPAPSGPLSPLASWETAKQLVINKCTETTGVRAGKNFRGPPVQAFTAQRGHSAQPGFSWWAEVRCSGKRGNQSQQRVGTQMPPMGAQTGCAPGTPRPPGLLGAGRQPGLEPFPAARGGGLGPAALSRLRQSGFVLGASPSLRPGSGALGSVLGDGGAVGELVSGPRSCGKIPGTLGGLGRDPDREPHKPPPQHECLQKDPFSPGPPTESPLRGGPRPAARLQQRARMGPGRAAARLPHHLHRGHPGPAHAHVGGLGSQRHVRVPATDGPGPVGERKKRALGGGPDGAKPGPLSSTHAHLWGRTPEPRSPKAPLAEGSPKAQLELGCTRRLCERDGIMAGRKTWRDLWELMPREASRTRRTVRPLTATRGDPLGRTARPARSDPSDPGGLRRTKAARL
ncbi:collagen alpha-1(III) chain-like [Antechinus flavipes]|uniref:collagen alpha-1(III) chain-like n=1 Tax=Antechinus flavipes TaxID=38775 RepID=UPI0022360594|nr:collagen alpha-1(III) chain-like [Antechinus flavipes]